MTTEYFIVNKISEIFGPFYWNETVPLFLRTIAKQTRMLSAIEHGSCSFSLKSLIIWFMWSASTSWASILTFSVLWDSLKDILMQI